MHLVKGLVVLPLLTELLFLLFLFLFRRGSNAALARASLADRSVLASIAFVVSYLVVVSASFDLRTV